MQALKVILVVACLAGIASAASWELEGKQDKEIPSKYEMESIEDCPKEMAGLELAQQEGPKCHSLLCRPCRRIVELLKENPRQANRELKHLCRSCGAPQNVRKCEGAIDRMIREIKRKSPGEICTEIGFCRRH